MANYGFDSLTPMLPNSGGYTGVPAGYQLLDDSGAGFASIDATGGGGANPAGGGWGSFLQNAFSSQVDPATGTMMPSWGSTAIKGVGAIGNLYLGMQQYGLARDQLDFTKEAFNKNYENQRTLTNSQLRDRQRARVAANPGAYQSVGSYMNQNGI